MRAKSRWRYGFNPLWTQTNPKSRKTISIDRFKAAIAMEIFRTDKFLPRFLLVWFVLSLGIAAASSWESPKSMDLVCTSGGFVKVVISDNDGTVHAPVHTMDCALCMAVGIPPSPIPSQFIKPSSLSHALHPIAAAHIAAVTAPPLPSRGPPTL